MCHIVQSVLILEILMAQLPQSKDSLSADRRQALLRASRAGSWLMWVRVW